MLAWEADFPDPENFLSVLLSRAQWGANNDSFYSNPALDSILAKAAPMTDFKERYALYDEAERGEVSPTIATRTEQGLLERRIHLLKERLRHAVTVEHETDEHVGVGSLVEIVDEDGETMEVEISAVGGVVFVDEPNGVDDDIWKPVFP